MGGERLRWVQLGCYFGWVDGQIPCRVWVSAILCQALPASLDGWGPLVEDQSTDDCVGTHRVGTMYLCGQPFFLPTSTIKTKADCDFHEIIRARFCNPASLPASRPLRDSQLLQGRFDTHTSPSRQPVICRFFSIHVTWFGSR